MTSFLERNNFRAKTTAYIRKDLVLLSFLSSILCFVSGCVPVEGLFGQCTRAALHSRVVGGEAVAHYTFLGNTHRTTPTRLRTDVEKYGVSVSV